MSFDKFAIDSAYDSIAVTQTTSPWVVGDGGSSLTIDAVSLDIRALTNADVVTVEQGTSPWVVSGTVELGATTLAALETINAVQSGSWEVSLSSASLAALETIELGATTLAALENITVDGTVELGSTTLAALESITVVASALDIRSLAFATDKVDVSGSSISTLEGAYSAWQAPADLAVTDSAGGTEIAATPLTGRVRIVVQNIGAKDCRIGPDNTLTATKGQLLKRGNSYEMILNDTANIFAIGVGGATTVCFAEYKF